MALEQHEGNYPFKTFNDLNFHKTDELMDFFYLHTSIFSRKYSKNVRNFRNAHPARGCSYKIKNEQDTNSSNSPHESV